jgi:hypothetical protein
MNSALGAKQLRERLDYMLEKGSNVGEIWARFQEGRIFQKARGLVVIHNGIHCIEGCRGLHAQDGVIG